MFLEQLVATLTIQFYHKSKFTHMYSAGTGNIMGNAVCVLIMLVEPTNLVINFTWPNLIDAICFVVLIGKNCRDE